MIEMIRIVSEQGLVNVIVPMGESDEFGFVGRLSEFFGKPFGFVLHFDKGSEGEFRFFENGALRSVVWTLFQISDGNVRRFVDGSFFGFFSTGKDIEQGGFSAAVGTDESDFVTCAELKRDIEQYRLGRKVPP
jgi:hypothetical protein